MKTSLIVTYDKTHIFILSKNSMAKIFIDDALDSNLIELLEQLKKQKEMLKKRLGI